MKSKRRWKKFLLGAINKISNLSPHSIAFSNFLHSSHTLPSILIRLLPASILIVDTVLCFSTSEGW